MDESLFSFRNFLRIFALSLIGAMVFFIATNSFVISQGNERIQNNQLEVLSKVLVSQASLSASQMIANQDQERLGTLTNQLAKERLVLDATVYNAEGVKLAASNDAVSAREVLGLDTPLSTASIGRQQLVEPIIKEGTIIGFIRITFETGKVTAISDHHYRKSDRYMYTMILMSFLCGLILMPLITKKRKNKEENLLLKQP
ncbi:YtjB family periplasmic protein [Vibrio sp. ZSDZ34]|jgi:membrane protein|uniref:YtjB family periplasmic protein n=1 Tax=Vibrio gelatinilyticus TaxID=2893468 RepID=A0A9X1WBW4_9VIBR|nr:YtjB family periplasmic protein [Vibrio gelatinilyticus]MCJ2375795.1 YtjB family periplasmic protein [Vibrio gelatinilyticus]